MDCAQFRNANKILTLDFVASIILMNLTHPVYGIRAKTLCDKATKWQEWQTQTGEWQTSYDDLRYPCI